MQPKKPGEWHCDVIPSGSVAVVKAGVLAADSSCKPVRLLISVDTRPIIDHRCALSSDADTQYCCE